MKFVGDLFGAGAVDTLFGEENMVGDDGGADVLGRQRRAVARRGVPPPGPSPVAVTKRQRGRDTDLPTACSPGLRAPAASASARDAPPRRADRAADGCPPPVRACTRPERTVANARAIRVSA